MGDDIEKYPFLFMNTPASLQILASVEVALMVWRCEYANTSHLFERPSLCFMKQKFSCKEVLVVPVPHRIEAQINEKIVNIGKELREWIDFHSDRDFLDADSSEAFCKCFKHIVVDFPGSIGYKASAINMLNSGEFSNVVNYKIACTFCLEDRVKRCWPLVANESRIDVNSQHDKCNLSYWNRWMKSGGNSISDTALIIGLMHEAEVFLNGTAFDYFCKMLPDHERVSEFISVLLDDECCHPVVMHSLLLRTLNRVQAEEVLKRGADAIFRFLVKSDKNFGYAHQLWTLMGHLILENESEFYYVVFGLWMLVFFPDHSDGLNYTQYGQINKLLLDIWSDASDELKAYVSNTFLRKRYISYIYKCSNTFPKPTHYGHDMTFMLEIMSKLRDVDREQLWQKYWRQLALRSKPVYLEQFMRMCLPNDDAIELFKIEIANYSDVFRSLIDEGFYSDLKDYVKFCSKDEKQCQQLGKKVLQSNLDVIFQHDDEKFAKFEWFVSELFLNMQKDAEEFKTQMISSAECLMYLLGADEIRSNDLRSIIKRFVNLEDELQLVKRKLFEHCCTYPVDYQCMTKTFNADRWQKFLEWCAGDHEEISTFKRSLNVDVIFLKRLEDYREGKCNVEGLDFLDDFLRWYFGNEEDAKNFKLQKVKSYDQIEILHVQMESNSPEYDFMHGLLKWFFHNDMENVREFCETRLPNFFLAWFSK